MDEMSAWRVPFRVSRVVIAAVAVAAGPAVGAAQPAAPGGGSAGWDDGFVLESGDGNFQMLLGMVLQADGRFAFDDPAPTIDTFTIRKVRPILSGHVSRWVNYRFMPDFGSGDVNVQDAWVELEFSSLFRLRAGKDKTPVGYEMLLSDPWVLFPERSLANSLVPNRDVGIQAQGDLAGGRIFYAGGFFNGVPDGASSAADRDTNNDKDVAGRIVIRPFAADAPLRGLGFQVGGTAGTQTGTLPAFRSPAGQTYFAYVDTADADGDRTRVTPAVFYYRGPFGAYAEYMHSSQSVRSGVLSREIANRAWNMTASLVLTGDGTSERGVSPEEPFDPETGGPGAIQVVVRVAVLETDDEAFASGLADAASSRRATSFGVGFDWYLNDYVKYYTTFERTTFDEGLAGREAEHVAFIRLQLAF
jgi:phosphate-selective porin OprO/OprP